MHVMSSDCYLFWIRRFQAMEDCIWPTQSLLIAFVRAWSRDWDKCWKSVQDSSLHPQHRLGAWQDQPSLVLLFWTFLKATSTHRVTHWPMWDYATRLLEHTLHAGMLLTPVVHCQIRNFGNSLSFVVTRLTCLLFCWIRRYRHCQVIDKHVRRIGTQVDWRHFLPNWGTQDCHDLKLYHSSVLCRWHDCWSYWSLLQPRKDNCLLATILSNPDIDSFQSWVSWCLSTFRVELDCLGFSRLPKVLQNQINIVSLLDSLHVWSYLRDRLACSCDCTAKDPVPISAIGSKTKERGENWQNWLSSACAWFSWLIVLGCTGEIGDCV